jgi:predicted molibdopterin-dependent oxidoreductase YjgC
MGVRPKTGVGVQNIMDTNYISKLKKTWGVNSLPKSDEECLTERFFRNDFHNLLIFGEDPVGTSLGNKDVLKAFSKAEFIMVQDAFMTETAKQADLILPASFWFETGGSFTNTQKVIQEFESGLKPKVERTTLVQLIDLLKAFGFNGLEDVNDVRAEIFSLLPKSEITKHRFVSTSANINPSLFNHGCDYFMAEFDKEFEA